MKYSNSYKGVGTSVYLAAAKEENATEPEQTSLLPSECDRHPYPQGSHRLQLGIYFSKLYFDKSGGPGRRLSPGTEQESPGQTS